MLDQTKLGTFLMESMETFEKEFGDEYELGDIMVIAEIQRRPNPVEDDDHGATHIVYNCSNPRRHMQIGMLHTAYLASIDDE